MNKLYTILFCLSCTLGAQSQTHTPWESYIEQNGLPEESETETLENLYDELSEWAATPLNLNQATREQLEQLPFLSYPQLNSLLEHRSRVGAIRSWNELAFADILDEQTLRLMQSFTYLGEESVLQRRLTWQNMARYGKHEAMTYAGIPCYTRHGDDEAYRGYPYRHWIRYTYNYGQQVKLALVGAQDAGEPFFKSPNHLGYDHYSFYLQLRDLRWLKSLVVGRYRIRTGAGLVLNTNYSYGKLASLDMLARQTNQMTGHSSRSDANYLQGAAATIALSRHAEFTAFVSHRAIDATLNADSSVATQLRTGYHRTQSEIDRKHNTRQTVAGANTALRFGPVHIGVTALHTSFNRPLHPNTQTSYRRYAPYGDRFWNLSADYSYTCGCMALSGETATGDGHAVATLNRASVTLNSRLSFLVIQRFYSYRYRALLGRSFGDNTEVTNESGCYIGARWTPLRHLVLSAYTDYAYFPWPRYGTSLSSHTWEQLVSLQYTRRHTSWQVRYRLKTRQRDNSLHTALTSQSTHRLQTSYTTRMGGFDTKTQAHLTYCQSDDHNIGYAVGQQVGYARRFLRLWGGLTYFHTHDYDSRVYLYERSMRYSFGYTSFYGHGLRYMLLTSAAVSPHLTLSAKAGITDYFDRDHISSGYQQIDRSSKTDIEVQAHLKF